MGKSKIEIDKEACISCGSCAVICPEIFEMGTEDNKAYVKKVEIDEIGCAQEAVDACPTQCIVLIEL